MGGKSGGSARTPVEAPESGRSKQRVKIVEVISEGQIGGLVNGLKSVYLDNTPIQNADDTYNYQNVEMEGRIGTQDQDVMSDFDTTEKEISVSAEVKKTTPLTRTVTDANVTRLRLTLGVQSLFKQEDNGDTNGAQVDFLITVGHATYNLTINGKYSSQYLRSIIIEDLPQVPFTVRVERLIDDSTSQRLQNKTVWASYTEIIDTDFSYPNTAYVGIKFDSEYFSNIPTRGYEIFGIEVKLPSNYDPETRKYTGLWDGTFKIAWTNNPAWILLDILTNERYGLGERLGDFGVDKWALYSIAQYCDQLVPDGYGNMEPRFTCNVWMTEQRAAYDVISDLCSIFRGIPVWNGTEMTFIIDRPADPVWTYTNANVINGEFSRQYSAKKSRHNAIQVEYKDKDNVYQSAIEYVSDNDLIRKNGFNLLKVTAFGCTSRGQAYRTGRWILETEKLETETVTFSVGSEGLMHIPGDIIRVTDNHFAGTNLGGRVLSVSGKVVTVDREITLPANSYFSYINAEAKHASIKITKINGTKLTLEAAPAGLKEYDVYSISSQKVTSRLYRCMTITEEDGTYTITALQHEPQKEAVVDNGASFEPLATSLLSGGLQKVSNADVSLSENGVEISFDYAANTTTAVKYQVKLYRNGELYRQLVDVTDTKLTFSNLPDGSYTVEIRAKNERGQLSDPITRTFEINLRIPRFITKSLLFAIELDWDLPKTATVGNYTEIWRASENDVSKAVKVATLPYPQNNYTINGVSLNESYYFFARCGDKVGNKGEFTEGVFGEADHNTENLVSALEGKITKSHLGKSLIESLKDDINEAVGEESKTRQQAVANALAQITAQAQSTGTAINELRNTDSQQAEKILTITAKAENALSGLQAEQKARADGDKANADKITTIASRVGTAESTIANLQSTKASKTEVSSIAQQAITAAMGDTKSQVSQVSKAVADVSGKLSAASTLKTQVIAGGRKAIAGIALGAESDGKTAESSVIVMADKFGIVANANDGNVKPVFSVANGQVGIRGDLVVAGSVTRDKLSGGAGENLLYNPIFANNGHGWTYYVDTANIDNAGYSFNANTGVYQSGAYLPTENQFRFQHTRKSTTGDVRLGGLYQDVKLAANKYYCFSAYVGAHRSFVDLNVEQGGISVIRKSWSGRGRTGGFPNNTIATGLENEYRIWLIFKTNANNSAEQNYRLILNTWGQNSQNNPMFIIRRPMLEECNASSTEPSPWSNAGAGPVHGGSIIANTIRGEHIQANQTLTSPNINGGNLNIGNGNFIVDSGGNVTAKKGTFSGTVRGAEIDGGVIKGATGYFSGTIYANKIEGDLAKLYVCQINKSLTIPAVPYNRIATIVPFAYGYTFNARENNSLQYARMIINIKMNNQNIYQGNLYSPHNGGKSEIYKEIDNCYAVFYIPANQEAVVSYEYIEQKSIGASVSFKKPDTICILYTRN